MTPVTHALICALYRERRMRAAFSGLKPFDKKGIKRSEVKWARQAHEHNVLRVTEELDKAVKETAAARASFKAQREYNELMGLDWIKEA